METEKGSDEPIWQHIRNFPFSPSSGGYWYSNIVTDERGTHRYLYMPMTNTNKFWRYDTYTDSFQQLADPPGPGYTSISNICMIFDPSRNYIWMWYYNSGSYFQYYDIATDTWTPRTTTLYVGADMTHTCTTYNNNGDDDSIYTFSLGSSRIRRYSISNNSWSYVGSNVMSYVIGPYGGGANIKWLWGYDPNKIWIMPGYSTNVIFTYDIQNNIYTQEFYIPATPDYYSSGNPYFTLGTACAYDGDKRIYITNNLWGRIHYARVDENKYYVACHRPANPGGYGFTGDYKNFCYKKSTDNKQYLYYNHIDQQFIRTKILN